MWSFAAARIAPVLAIGVAALIPGSVHGQVIWANPWIYQAPPQMDSDPDASAVEFTQDGGVILASPSYSEMSMQAMRLGPSGDPLWAANLYAYEGIYEDIAGSAIELPDGGAIVSMFGQYGSPRGKVTRLDAVGHIVWTRQDPLSWLSRYGPDRIAFAGCNTLSVADMQSGNVLWQRNFDAPRTCWPTTGAVDEAGNIYAAFTFKVGNSISGYRIEKFKSDGSSEWNVVAASPDGGSIVGTDGTTLYARTNSELRALRTTDGSEIWSVPMENDAQVALTFDTPAEPIVRTAEAIKRLHGQSGSTRWSAVVNVCHFYCMPRFVSASALVIVNGSNLERFDVSNGAMLWSAPLPVAGANGASLRWFAFGGLVGNQFSGIAYETTDGKPVHIQRFDLGNGTALATIPSPAVDHGAYNGDSSVEGSDVFDLAIGPDSTATRIRLRRTDAASGTVLWDNAEASLPAPHDTYGYHLTWPPEPPEVGADAVATATSWLRFYGLVYVSVHERSTGSQRWGRVLEDPGQRMAYTSAPVFDPAGDVFVATGTSVWCGIEGYCPTQTLYKLSGANGDILWEFSHSYQPSDNFPRPWQFDLVGGDVILPSPVFGDTLVRLAGADGGQMWSSELLDGESISLFYRQDDDHIIVNSQHHLSRVDLNTASVLWSTPYPDFPCTSACYWYRDLFLANGDQLVTGENDSKPRVVRMHNDGSGAHDLWTLEPNDPALRSAATQVATTPSGKVMIRLVRYLRLAPTGLSVLAEFNPDTGAITSEQVIGSRAIDPTSQDLAPSLIGMPAENRMLFGVFGVDETLPKSLGSGLMDTTIIAHGDLTLSVETDQESVDVGDSMGFRVVANYSGDLPLSGVAVQVGTSTLASLSELNCSAQAAANCILDDRSGNVHARFDIQPGGSVEITGRMLSLRNAETHYFGGVVWGPVGLSEPDTVNNFSRALIVQPLFADGFD